MDETDGKNRGKGGKALFSLALLGKECIWKKEWQKKNRQIFPALLGENLSIFMSKNVKGKQLFYKLSFSFLFIRKCEDFQEKRGKQRLVITETVCYSTMDLILKKS